mmetsp:Transcript_19212/g.26022  ORF Transcript_19212/g.26022 Transcript_19212/m.26022 type:complete len:291 (-) Transcript_19212:2899-3771(-)
MRGVLLSDAQGLTVHLVLLIHSDGLLGLLGSEVALLGLREVVLLHVRVSLLELHSRHALRVVLAGHLDGRVPVALVLIHVDGFLGLVGLNELLLGLLEAVVVLKVESVLQVHVRELVASMVLGKLEGVVEALLVSLEVDGSLDQTVLDQELGAALGAHSLSDLDGDLAELFLGTVGLGDAESLVPEVVSAIHVDGVGPGATLDVVVLGLLEVALHLERLGKVVVRVLEQVSAELDHESDHVVEHLRLFVHVDGEIGLTRRQIHLLSLLVVTLSLEFLRLSHLNRAILALG